MDNLLDTVRQRYTHTAGYRGLFTLAYRSWPESTPKPVPDAPPKRGLFELFRPQLSDISKKLHAEINRLFQRRDNNALQLVNRDIPRLIDQRLGRWSADSIKIEKARLEALKRTEKHTQQVFAGSAARIKALERDIQHLKAQDLARRHQLERTTPEDLPLSHRAAHRITHDAVQHVSETMRQEISHSAAETRRSVMRKLQSELEYEKWRRG